MLKIEGSDFLLPARFCTGSNKWAKKNIAARDRGQSVGWLYCCAAVLLYRSESVSYIISREGTSRVHTRLLVRANDAPHHTASADLCQQEAYYSCMPIRTQVNVMWYNSSIVAGDSSSAQFSHHRSEG